MRDKRRAELQTLLREGYQRYACKEPCGTGDGGTPSTNKQTSKNPPKSAETAAGSMWKGGGNPVVSPPPLRPK